MLSFVVLRLHGQVGYQVPPPILNVVRHFSLNFLKQIFDYRFSWLDILLKWRDFRQPGRNKIYEGELEMTNMGLGVSNKFSCPFSPNVAKVILFRTCHFYFEPKTTNRNVENDEEGGEHDPGNQVDLPAVLVVLHVPELTPPIRCLFHRLGIVQLQRAIEFWKLSNRETHEILRNSAGKESRSSPIPFRLCLVISQFPNSL